LRRDGEYPFFIMEELMGIKHLCLVLIGVILLCAMTAQAVPLSNMTTTPTLTDGTFTYSNWSAELDVYGLDNIPTGYHITISPLDDIDVQAVNGSLILTGIAVSGTNVRPIDVALHYSYRVSVQEDMQLAGVQLVVPEAEGVLDTASIVTFDGTRLECTTSLIIRCANGHLALSGQSVDVEASAQLNLHNVCSIGPATPPGLPPGGGCTFGLRNTVIETRFTAVPEPSTVILLASGFLALAWLKRR
jgi:hypothetical protein